MKSIKTYTSIFILSLLILNSCDFRFAGSYANAQYYEFNLSTVELINRIKQFKENNPEYKGIIKGEEIIDNIDGINFYGASFNIEKRKMIIYGVINMYGDTITNPQTYIGLNTVLVNVGTDSAKFYQLKELPKDKRKEVIHIFENEILNNLGNWRHN